MNCVGRYIGKKETKVHPGTIYRIGYFKTLNTYTIRCRGVEFVYFTMQSMLEDWIFYAESDYPIECT